MGIQAGGMGINALACAGAELPNIILERLHTRKIDQVELVEANGLIAGALRSAAVSNFEGSC